jgi:hypothetical protein
MIAHNYAVEHFAALIASGEDAFRRGDRIEDIAMDHDLATDGDEILVLDGIVCYLDENSAIVGYPSVSDRSRAAELYETDEDWEWMRGDESVPVHFHSAKVEITWHAEAGSLECYLADEMDHVFVIHPKEPDCDSRLGGSHQWEPANHVIPLDSATYAVGGASMADVAICVYCGMSMITYSPSQGHESVTDHSHVIYADDAASIEELVDYHNGDCPDDLVPDSALFCAIVDVADDRKEKNEP